MKQVVMFGSPEGAHMSGRVSYELRVDGQPLFTVESLREVFKGTLRGAQKHLSPESLAYLAEQLGNIAAMYHLRKTGPNYEAKCDALRASLDCIWAWIAERGLGQGTRAHEAFVALVEELNETEIDPTGQGLNVTRPAVNWKGKHYGDKGADIASACAEAVQRTLIHAGRREWGYSNDGPLPRFVAAVIPSITGDAVTVQQVAKHLKDTRRLAGQRAEQQQTGTTGG